MSLPIYNPLYLSSHTEESIHARLKHIRYDQKPIVLIVEQLGELQSEAIEHIDSFFKKSPFPTLPYTLYIIGYYPEYTGSLFIVDNLKKLPQFYNQALKPLNSRESIVQKKVLLQKINLKNLTPLEHSLTIKKYACQHSKIYQLQVEHSYINKIANILESNHESKEK